MDAEDFLLEALTELKRANHILFVSLKYTRTCDVLMNIVNRIIRTFDFAGLALLTKFKEDNLIENIPPSIIERQKVLISTMSNEEDKEKMKKFIDFYNIMRLIKKSPYEKEEEFRRNVNLISFFDENHVLELNIDSADRFFKKTIDFIDFIKKFINPEEE